MLATGFIPFVLFPIVGTQLPPLAIFATITAGVLLTGMN
jgi:hypothetical protein